ncbi:MAG TPA: DMT family transporter [Gemmatimonadaceae bacterium]|jgi:drug/metabolite transporter (DMT)-like permease
MGYAALAAAGSVWGTAFVFGKWALTELSVGHMVLLRFVFASLGMSVALWRERRHGPIRIARRDVGLVLAGAIVGVPVQYLVQFQGLAHTTVSHASLMVGILPVLLGVAAALFTHERLDAFGWSGLVASTVGAGLVAFGGGDADSGPGASLFGDLLVVASLFAGVVWILVCQRLMARRYSPATTSAIVIVVGTLLLAVWVIGTEGLPNFATLSARTWISVATLGLFATTIATLLWNWGLARVPASQAGVFVNLEPLVGAILGVALFDDTFGLLSIVGGLLIVVAAVVVTSRSTA